jgi:K+/H+ antiporter YhaU regulatory subunit KhtT
MPNIEISAIDIDDESEVIGRSVADIQLRKEYGVTLVAVKRGDEIIEHPSSKTIFQRGDVVYVLGNYEQNAAAEALFSASNSQ